MNRLVPALTLIVALGGCAATSHAASPRPTPNLTWRAAPVFLKSRDADGVVRFFAYMRLNERLPRLPDGRSLVDVEVGGAPTLAIGRLKRLGRASRRCYRRTWTIPPTGRDRSGLGPQVRRGWLNIGDNLPFLLFSRDEVPRSGPAKFFSAPRRVVVRSVAGPPETRSTGNPSVYARRLGCL